MPGCSGGLVVTCSCAFHFRTRGCGCNGHPAFPTPSLGGRFWIDPGASASRGGEGVSLTLVIPGCADATNCEAILRGRRRPGIHRATVVPEKWILRCAIAHHSSALRAAPE